MKKIIAIVKPFAFEDVKHRLQEEFPFQAMTVTDAKGYGSKGMENRTEGEYAVDCLPKLKIELVVEDARVNQVIEVIAAAANNGKIGDGMIFVEDGVEARSIRKDGEQLTNDTIYPQSGAAATTTAPAQAATSKFGKKK